MSQSHKPQVTSHIVHVRKREKDSLSRDSDGPLACKGERNKPAAAQGSIDSISSFAW